MKIKFRCLCGKRLKVSARKAGSNVACPLCSRKIAIPDINSTDILEIACDCGKRFAPNVSQCPSCAAEVPGKKVDKSSVSPQTIPIQYSTPFSEKSVSWKLKLLWGVCLAITLISSTYIILNFSVLIQIFKGETNSSLISPK